MKRLSVLITIFMIIGCSNKTPNIQDQDMPFQRYLSEKNLNQLEKDLDSYDEK